MILSHLLIKIREAFAPNIIIWLDTIKQGRVDSSKINELKKIKNLPFDANLLFNSKAFEDTNKIFEPPKKIDKHITHFLSDEEIKIIAKEIQ